MKLIKVGYVAGSFGLDGALKVRQVTDNPGLFNAMEYLLLTKNGEVAGSYKIKSLRDRGGFLLVRVEGVNDKGKADALKGLSVSVPEDALPEAGSDEVYWYKIKGASVLNERGGRLGELADYIETGGGDVFRVKMDDGGFCLISNNKSHVLAIDPEAGIVTVAEEGLIREDI